MSRRLCLLAVIATGLCFSLSDSSSAQPPRTRDPQAPAAGRLAEDWPRTRKPEPAAGAREKKVHRARARDYHGTGPASQTWRLGIVDERAPHGLRIQRVFDGPASDIGLEPGDYILDVGGYVVGEYQGTFYPLAMAMDLAADRQGWAELLIWNCRTYAEETRWVQFARR